MESKKFKGTKTIVSEDGKTVTTVTVSGSSSSNKSTNTSTVTTSVTTTVTTGENTVTTVIKSE